MAVSCLVLAKSHARRKQGAVNQFHLHMLRHYCQLMT
jgi:hypothetical protein